ncbi:MAG TPA: EF-Tu/IF-2/RF-3 family GTPase [Nitrososphaerales archaeon]|nr:EF-Tu/IF-2/RF-3 family GTPase [Nitrososphaerales archaeon]
MVEGLTVGVFGSDPAAKGEFEASVAKKSEAEGMIVYHRKEGERRISILDDSEFPERIQGYARIASLSDYAYYIAPTGGRLSKSDGELAVLLDSFRVPGTVVTQDGGIDAAWVRASFRGTALESYALEVRPPGSALLGVGGVATRRDLDAGGTVVYMDRAFNVNGLGTVALGFVLSGEISLHDELRTTPSPKDTKVEVKGIQVNDVDQERVGRGIRVGLALRGVDARSLQKTHWLDDGSLAVTDRLSLSFAPSPYYRQAVSDRDLHIQLPGEMVTASMAKGARDGEISAKLPYEVPVWKGMGAAVVDLNGKGLRVAGGCICNV